MASLAKTQERPVERLMQAATGYMASAALHAAAKLNIADLLANGPRSVSDLAEAAGVNEDALYRILRALASLGIFAEAGPRRFALSPAAEALRTGTPESIRDLVVWIGNPFHFEVWAQTPYSVRTGRPAVELVCGKPCFEAMAGRPEVAREFHDGMTCFSAMLAPALLDAYDFTGVKTLMDVAGGHGYILSEVLARYPNMQGVLFDMPGVVEGAESRMRSLNLSNRCQLVAGDFFERIPAGADAYYMQHIIHDWDDARALRILRNCAQALEGRRNGKLLVMDSVIPENSQPHLGKFIDLEMLLMPGGRERTEPEFRQLFAKAGFEIARITPTRAPQSVIEARLK